MAIVKVWNRNKYDHTEEFKGQKITIKAGESIEMDYIDAIDFKGQFTPKAPQDATQPERFYKMLEVEAPKEPIVKEDPNVFHATGEKFASVAEVIKFAREFSSQNPERVLTDPTVADPREAEISALKAQVERLAALVESNGKKKPGPKTKVAKAIA